MTKEEYRDKRRALDIEAMRIEQGRCDLEVKLCQLTIDKENLQKQSLHLEKRRLDLEMKYVQAKIDGKTGYEEDEEDDE